MTIEFNWSVDRLECNPELQGLTNVVYRIYYTCSASNGTKTAKSSDICNLKVANVSPETFTAYNLLTKDQVLGWVFEIINKQSVEQTLQVRLNRVRPELVSTDLPFSN